MSERESTNKIVRGTKRYKNWIHSESKKADLQKNLPFKFSKPTKHRPTNELAECPKCSKLSAVSEYTKAVICTCGELYRLDFTKEEKKDDN
jgi:hypothetical protein